MCSHCLILGIYLGLRLDKGPPTLFTTKGKHRAPAVSVEELAGSVCKGAQTGVDSSTQFEDSVPSCILESFAEIAILITALGLSSTSGTVQLPLGKCLDCFSGLGVAFSDSDSTSTALFARKTQTRVPVAHYMDFCRVGP